MSILTTLRPDSSDDSGGDLDPNLAGTGWGNLSDNSDSSWVSNQLSSFEPTRTLQGGWGNLPVGVGRVNSLQARMRASASVAASASMLLSTDVGTGRINANPLADVITNYASATFTTYTTKAQVDALGWALLSQFISNPGVQVFVYELYLDVDWDPAISGLKGLLFSVLGPLVAVGLHEMPAIGRELLRRSSTRLGPAELERAWRELREDRGRLYFPL